MKDREARSDIRHLTSWVRKVLLRWSERLDEVDALEQRVDALEQGLMTAQPTNTLRERLETAVLVEQVVMFRYTKPDERDWELRQLSPYEVIPVEHGVVVRGWDHQRLDIRSFRLDRLEALTTCNGSKYRAPQS